MAIMVAIILGLWGLAVVLYPLYHRSVAFSSTRSQSQQMAPLAEQEQGARLALQEVELDYQLGNLAEPEYRALRERYVARAIQAMQARDQSEQELDESIESQLRQLKEHHEQA
ncbi:hypothetical protein [Tengunoibacter tsumagoiensis]|uniref:C-type cytochrome biogenesis protein CcmI n=1 Tax=Tengunoibacter tsumagoiensis TaxID=2014871 RepID=A0A402A5P6_9CHLR|nr:hypothetical protein [Tengunoibacter tsumagoiensis]GCE14376.1 hypothetical protein KTT_42350 [Tengunoibacter tsumagoiensis]